MFSRSSREDSHFPGVLEDSRYITDSRLPKSSRETDGVNRTKPACFVVVCVCILRGFILFWQVYNLFSSCFTITFPVSFVSAASNAKPLWGPKYSNHLAISRVGEHSSLARGSVSNIALFPTRKVFIREGKLWRVCSVVRIDRPT